MIRFISFITLVPVALLGSQTLADAAPMLKPAVVVSSDIVTIGDLIAGAGPKAGRAVFRAPDLGQTGTVSARDIINAAAAQGLGAVDAGGISAVSVTRASRTVRGEDLRLPLQAALAANAGVDDAETIAIEMDAGFTEIQLPVEADGAVQITDTVWQSDRFDAILTVRRIDGGEERRAIRGQAFETAAVMTTTRAVERGAVLTESDVKIERRPIAEARQNMLSDAVDAIGKQAKRALREGQPLRPSDLDEPTLVKNGAAVTIVLKSGGLTLTATAQALRDGKLGDSIQVMNGQSKRVLQAVVTGQNQVSVQPPRTLVSAAK